MATPGDSREPASSPCQAPPGFWDEEEAPAEKPAEEGVGPCRPREATRPNQAGDDSHSEGVSRE